MIDKITLPAVGEEGEAWALLRDPKAVTERQRRPITNLSAQLAGFKHFAAVLEGDTSELSPELLAVLNDLNDAVVVALIDSWSFPDEVTVDNLLDLPGDVYDVLRKACAPHVVALMPDFDPTPEPGTPSPPSSE